MKRDGQACVVALAHTAPPRYANGAHSETSIYPARLMIGALSMSPALDNSKVDLILKGK